MIETGWFSITVINVLIGITLLTLGSKLLWLFVGFIGFAVGFEYAASVWQLESQLLLIGLAALTGIVGAVLAVFFQKIAVSLNPGMQLGLFWALAIFGLVIQTVLYRKSALLTAKQSTMS